MKKNIKTLVILIITLLLTLPLYAQSVGHLVVEKGMIKLRSNQTDRIIKAGPEEVPLLSKDEIQSGKDSRTKIYLNNKNETIDLFSNTFFNVSSVTEEESKIYLPIGKVRCKITPSFSKLTNKRRKFQVRTAHALVSVKGSEMVVQTNGLTTNLLTISGVIAFASVERPDVEVNVTKNQASKAEKGAAPTPPVDVPADVVDSIANEDTGAGFEGVEFGDVPETGDVGGTDDTGAEAPEIPNINDIVPDDIDSARETVSETQTTGDSTDTDSEDTDITITIVEE